MKKAKKAVPFESNAKVAVMGNDGLYELGFTYVRATHKMHVVRKGKTEKAIWSQFVKLEPEAIAFNDSHEKPSSRRA